MPEVAVDLTTMSRAEKQSKNSNATNHHIIGSCGAHRFAQSDYDRFYDTTMMAVPAGTSYGRHVLTRAYESARLFASENLGNALVLANPLGGVNSRQEGKLAHGL